MPSVRAMQVYLLAGAYLVFGTTFLINLVQALFAESIFSGGARLFSSPWSITALSDYFVGACFAVFYLYHRDGPAFFGIPCKVLAFLVPFLGNFLLMWYMAFLLILNGNLTATFLPRTDQQSVGPANHRKSRFIAFYFGALLAKFIAVCAWAAFAETLADGYENIVKERYATLTFLDNLVGLAFTASFVVIREGGPSCAVMLWLLAFVFLGNAPTCVYAFLIAMESLRRNVPIEQVLLSRVKNDQTTSFV